MSKYEQYKESHSAAHALLAAIAVIFTAIGCYNIWDMQQAVAASMPYRTAHKEMGMVGAIVLLPVVLWLEWRCRQQAFPSKKLLIAIVTAIALLVVVAQEIAPQRCRDYFVQHGYELCAKYHSQNTKTAKNWEVWGPKGRCPANPREV